MRFLTALLVWPILSGAVAKAENWHFPEPEKSEWAGQVELSVTLVKLPVLDAIDLIWNETAEDRESFIAGLVQAGSAEQLVQFRTETRSENEIEVTEHNFRDEIVTWQNGRVFLRPSLYTRDTRDGGVPALYDQGSLKFFVGTRFGASREMKQGTVRSSDPFAPAGNGEVSFVDWMFHYDFKEPTTYQWRNAPFKDGASLNYLHFHYMRARSVAPVGIDRAFVMAVDDFIGDEPGSCVLLGKGKKAKVNGRENFMRIDTVVFSIRSRKLMVDLLNRSDSSGDIDLLQRLVVAAKESPQETRAVSFQSLISQSGWRSTTRSVTDFFHPTGFEPSGGEDNTRKPRRYISENFRVVPNQLDSVNVGSELEFDPVLSADGKWCDLSLSVSLDVEPPRFGLLKTNPALSTEEDPAAVEGPEFHESKLVLSLSVPVGETRLVSTQMVQTDTPAVHVRFVRVVTPFGKEEP